MAFFLPYLATLGWKSAPPRSERKGVVVTILNSLAQHLQYQIEHRADNELSVTSNETTSTSYTSQESVKEGEQSFNSDSILLTSVAASSSRHICFQLRELKNSLCGGDNGTYDESSATDGAKELVQNIALFNVVIMNMHRLPLEAVKDVAIIFNRFIRKDYDDFALHLLTDTHFDAILSFLVHGYDNPAIALFCGSMLRGCFRHDAIVRVLLNSPQMWLFFDSYAHLPNFEVALDAVNTLRTLLIPGDGSSSNLVPAFVELNFDDFFRKFEVLVTSENFVTRVRSFKLLGEVLHCRKYYKVMMKFVSMRHFLKLIMKTLRDKSPGINIEAFHIFKIFVANPSKPHRISSILHSNKNKIISFLQSFHVENCDRQFCDEKDMLVEMLLTLDATETDVDTTASTPNPTIASVANEDVKKNNGRKISDDNTTQCSDSTITSEFAFEG